MINITQSTVAASDLRELHDYLHLLLLLSVSLFILCSCVDMLKYFCARKLLIQTWSRENSPKRRGITVDVGSAAMILGVCEK